MHADAGASQRAESSALAAARPGGVGRVAWIVWAAGMSAYMVAVFHRFSLAVASDDAVHRFGVSAAGLGAFSVLQLAVYCIIQVPVGMVVDRFGFRRPLVAGALLMTTGQAIFATAHPQLLRHRRRARRAYRGAASTTDAVDTGEHAERLVTGRSGPETGRSASGSRRR